ncbi:hypothetical protein KY342_00270 [Candidatus Woesearchaeota archaeon]|nr:hypothetical protein [Candidatus Woesearchaeota archaeon]
MTPKEYLQQQPGLAEYIKMVKMDQRSLSQILDNAMKHYKRYQRNQNQGERFAYLSNMFTLREHLDIARTEYAQLEKIELAEFVLGLLDITKDCLEEYTRKHFNYIQRVINLLEQQSITDSDLKKCRKDISQIQRAD